MSKLSRYTQKVFGSSASTDEMSQYGSFAAGTPSLYSGSTITPALVQNLSNYLGGIFSGSVGNNSGFMQDFNALFNLITYQLTYLFQEGIPEYDASTTYYSGSFCSSGGVTYISTVDNNTGNALTSSNWKVYINQGIQNKTANYQILATDLLIICDSTSASFTVTLPDATLTSGLTYTVKKTNVEENAITVTGTSGQTINSASNYYVDAQDEAASFTSDGSNWQVTARAVNSANLVESSSSSTFSTTSQTYVAVTNLSVDIIVSGLRPVLAMIVSDEDNTHATNIRSNEGGSSPTQGTAGFTIQFYRDAVIIGTYIFGATSATSSGESVTCSGSLLALDPDPAAGSHTYSVQIKASGDVGCAAACQYAKLVAYEL